MKRRIDSTQMRISRETTKALVVLAQAIVEESDESAAGPTSFREGFVPDHLASDESDSFHIRGRKYLLYRLALWHLIREKTLEHLTDRDIDTELWALVCELDIKRPSYGGETALRKRVSEFLRAIERPWVDFEAIFRLSDLRVTAEFDVSGVTLRKITASAARKWGLDGDDYLNQTAKELTGTVALTQVRAGSHQKASERAKEKVDDALNLLRFALCGAINANVWDEQMLFQRSGAWAVKALDRDSRPRTNYERGFRPFGMEMSASLSGILTEYLSPEEEVITGEAPPRLQQRVIRAIHWIGTSVTRETYDDKVLDLCTALESILTTKEEKRKAEAIAVRSMLLPAALGKGFPDPGIVFLLYATKRSDLSHGSEHRICNRQDYDRLRHLAVYMVKLYVQLVKRHPAKAKHTRIIEAIDSPDSLKQVISLLEPNPGPIADELRTFAERRLAVMATSDALALLAGGLFQRPLSEASTPTL